jgi:tRNA(Ile2)-agmatinylcytidine synthase
MEMVHLHIGIDDTDSPRTGCTTYVASLLVEKLTDLDARFMDYPNLVRLNPNVPWKTRGNGALCLRIECDERSVGDVKEAVLETVEENSDFEYAGTDPGIVFLSKKIVPKEVRNFAQKTIQSIVKMNDSLKLVRKISAEAVGYKSGRGIIGALAAVGETLEGDHTYELIAYRFPENRGTKRLVDATSVSAMDKKTVPLTFNNIDLETNRVLITPRGPDPVFFGIRGENPVIVKEAFDMVQCGEPIERWVIFRTNQGTNAHLRKINRINDIRPFHNVILRGTVVNEPKIVPRRHVIFSIKDDEATVDCAAYEPTGDLRKAAKQLMIGDKIEVSGAVRPAFETRPMTINLEKIRIIKLVLKVSSHNPKCPKCGKAMSSMGKAQGYRCEKCRYRSKQLTKIGTAQERALKSKLYITSPHSQRHLTKPLRRYGMEKRPGESHFEMIQVWHSPSAETLFL